jgi:hypothetical protein
VTIPPTSSSLHLVGRHRVIQALCKTSDAPQLIHNRLQKQQNPLHGFFAMTLLNRAKHLIKRRGSRNLCQPLAENLIDRRNRRVLKLILLFQSIIWKVIGPHPTSPNTFSLGQTCRENGVQMTYIRGPRASQYVPIERKRDSF